MDYKEIKKKHPKAWALLKEWFGYKKDTTVSMELSKIFMPERKLYDFFDEQKIIISINGYKGLSSDLEWGWNIEHSKGVSDCSPLAYYSRIEAEEESFLEAFEILEQVLTK